MRLLLVATLLTTGCIGEPFSTDADSGTTLQELMGSSSSVSSSQSTSSSSSTSTSTGSVFTTSVSQTSSTTEQDAGVPTFDGSVVILPTPDADAAWGCYSAPSVKGQEYEIDTYNAFCVAIDVSMQELDINTDGRQLNGVSGSVQQIVTGPNGYFTFNHIDPSVAIVIIRFSSGTNYSRMSWVQ